MKEKEIILSRIADVMGRKGFIKKGNGELKARLKCIGLYEYYEKHSEYLTPYYYKDGWENSRNEYNVFLGLDFIFTDLYNEKKNEEIIRLLKELTKSFNISYIKEELVDDFEELGKLYGLLGLDIYIDYDKVKLLSVMKSDNLRIDEVLSVESWLLEKHEDVYQSYDSAINSYINGHTGTCIEACRTSLVSIFSKYKGTQEFAKWMRGVFNISGDDEDSNTSELATSLNKDLRKDDLAEFFNENKSGKLTKTKTIYMIYSMMSDYGTHRNESTKENPSIEDALFMLRLTDSILFWIYSKGTSIKKYEN